MRKFIAALSFALIASVLLSGVTFAKDCESLYSDVLRLHILANSDSKEDQTLKIKVRDKILSMSDTLFYSGNDGILQAEKSVADNIKHIEEIAQEFICEQGYNYNVKCELVNMYFNTREYDTFTMPAGNYDALRITIGKGEGKNWWCVLYPPLCLSASIKSKNIDALFNKKQADLLKGKQKYKYKFALVELYNKVITLFD